MKITPHGPLKLKMIENLAPRAERYDVKDAAYPGLQLRVTPNGAKSFRWAVRDANGKQRWITIGRWSPVVKPGHVTLGQAHHWLERLKEANRTGQLAVVEAELKAFLSPTPVSVPGAGKTVNDAAAEFWKVLETQRKRGSREAKPIFVRHIQPHVGDLPLHSLRRSTCGEIVQRAFSGGATVHAAKVLGTLKQLLDFAERRGFAGDDWVNPAARLKASDFGVRAKSRKRWLDEAEIRTFWRALDMLPRELEHQRMAAVFRILLLTGARTGELRLAEQAHVDLGAATWTVPVANQKLTPKQAEEAHDFVIPLTATALEQFSVLKRLAGDSRWLLPGRGEKTGVYDEKSIGRYLRGLWKGEPKRRIAPHPAFKGHTPFAPHDLRRTCRTWLGKLGVEPHVAERVLNHRLGRIVATYDRHDYLAQRREALERWDAHVRGLISG